MDPNLMVWGNRSFEEIKLLIGQSPFYAYDRGRINFRVEHLRSNFPKDVKIHYAIKANPMAAVVQHLATQVDGFDVASGNELLNALNTGINPNNISFSGPGKSLRELQQAIAAGVVINVESSLELDRVMEIQSKIGKTALVSLRINPDYVLKGAGMKMSGGSKQFGVDREQAPDLLKRIKNANLIFVGLQIFSGSQNLNSDTIAEIFTKNFELLNDLRQNIPQESYMMTLGGGLGIPYFSGEKEVDLKPIGSVLDKLDRQFKTISSRGNLIVELGRYLVGEAGVYVCEVVDKKVSRGQIFLVLNGGLNHHLAATGNLGQVIKRPFPIGVVQRNATQEQENVTLVGPLCTPLDTFADKISLPRAEVGDLVVIYQSGAYGATASPQGFLSHAGVPEILI